MAENKWGLWLIGARGSVATVTTVGLAAVARGLVEPIGLLTESQPYSKVAFPAWDKLVIGGHEIRQCDVLAEARRMASQDAALPSQLVEASRDFLQEVDRRIRPGTLAGCGPAAENLANIEIPTEARPADTIERLATDLRRFANQYGLDHVVVVNVASTEPRFDATHVPERWTELEPLLHKTTDTLLPASTLYAIAAAQAGCSYINFTPSLGSALKAVDDLFNQRGLPHMGCDGKTGETLLKSVLAPLFKHRHLRVLSWVGHNIFGNLDGRVLDDPAHKASKIATKDRVIHSILGYAPQTLVSIEYIESLGEWKTAWDHVHFAGFLGTKMTLQFTWQGCDSILAAPLVLDLARLTYVAWERGHKGLMPFLACFFKDPLGTTEHNFERQVQMLESWLLKGC